jgi:hypothetical protein
VAGAGTGETGGGATIGMDPFDRGSKSKSRQTSSTISRLTGRRSAANPEIKALSQITLINRGMPPER